MTTSTVSKTTTTSVHKQAGLETLIATLSSGGVLTYLATVAHTHLAPETAVIASAVAAVAAFARKEAPYVAKLLAAWRVLRKNKKVAAATAKLTNSPEFKQAVADFVAASKVPEVAEVEKTVETTVTTPAS
jgi:hypothetical protein